MDPKIKNLWDNSIFVVEADYDNKREGNNKDYYTKDVLIDD